mmetsp:Transcript_34794/g.44880  ORF Transcript_34794/g.44880 Transcript_34794/m.44880 type:complete len:375 (+) Transcript_34794:49-1173(+)
MSSARRLGRSPVRIHPGDGKVKRNVVTNRTQQSSNQTPLWPAVVRKLSGSSSNTTTNTPSASVDLDNESTGTTDSSGSTTSLKLKNKKTTTTTTANSSNSPPSPDCVANVPDEGGSGGGSISPTPSSSNTKIKQRNSGGNRAEPSSKLKSTPIGSPSKPIAIKIPKLKVVLDMDECLIHSIFNEGIQPGRMPFARPNAPPPSPPPQHITPQTLESFPLKMLDNASCLVNKRPRIDWFLEQVANRFETYVMTAGTRDYAEPLLDKLDSKRLLKGRFYRDSCVFHDGHYFKDLNLVDQDPRRIVLVDNNPASFVLCPANGIPVISFYDDPNDRALEQALEVLISLENENDVRRMLRQMYNLETKLAPMVRHFQRRM